MSYIHCGIYRDFHINRLSFCFPSGKKKISLQRCKSITINCIDSGADKHVHRYPCHERRVVYQCGVFQTDRIPTPERLQSCSMKHWDLDTQHFSVFWQTWSSVSAKALSDLVTQTTKLSSHLYLYSSLTSQIYHRCSEGQRRNALPNVLPAMKTLYMKLQKNMPSNGWNTSLLPLF